MSRFFQAGSDSEDNSDFSEDSVTDQSDNDSQSDSDSDDARAPAAASGGAKKPALTGRSKWAKTEGSDSDSSSDSSDDDSDDSDGDSDGSDDSDAKKTIKSARDKRFEEMRSAVSALHNANKISDWVNIQNEFDRLLKGVSKASVLIEREGVPRFFVRSLVQLDDYIKDSLLSKENAKKMNATAAKALNAMKQKIKKVTKAYESNIEKFREAPIDEDESEAEAVELSRKSLKDAKDAKEAASAAIVTANDSDEEGEGDAAGKSFTVVGKGGKPIDLSPEGLFSKLAEVLDARGKKSTDKLAQIEILVHLLGASVTPYQKVRMLLALIPARFDYVPVSGFMSAEMWNKTLCGIKDLLHLLDENPHITLSITTVEENEDEEVVAEPIRDRHVTAGQPVVLSGNIASFVDRLDDEFTKSLQSIDPHTTEYIDRLRDETLLYASIVRAIKYSMSTGASQKSIDLMIMRRIEHLYNKPDLVIKTVEGEVCKMYPTLSDTAEVSEELVQSLCRGLYKSSIGRIRTRALLCHVYHLALHDSYHEARDMILMSHVQETIMQTDIHMQVLFNRTMVQIGLCAFRAGLFRDAATCLQDIASSGKTRELLAQGIQQPKYAVEKTAEQERLERQRQLPFHMHVNLELLECVYLVSSMLLEVPNMALHAHESRRRVISKSFRRMLDFNDRQVFVGPPENVRDHIMAGAKAMAAGDWRKCRDYIHNIKIWDLLAHADRTRETLTRSIQEESLRTYVFTYAPFYESMEMGSLADMFELPVDRVCALVSKMTTSDELHASLDSSSGCIVFHRPAPGIDMSRLEFMAGVYADKVASLVDANEKLLESRSVTLGLQEQREYMQQREQQGGGGGGGHRGGRGGRVGGGSGRSAGGHRTGGAGSGFRFRTAVGK
ncbi:hypothetical protein BASA50_003241 [Batrachochytrium salamandrivorans]|uniref:Eukaryotic translation initiation factor 3 subunit C n=1 Tax=Batrachochytrium salamandrivorans TaxID=1357716 RepID=A0ABQ8FJ21_9FUNG|nr:hypothetical protein BASA62_003404 [Batrachochytrium salamandrivorans]KAH6582705.1 hypothetical protein BASA61_008392 [Batrachochytrium salamandrivorans]KAH6599099.1 hypothetical protein BASA50_003241 [Batrachochytrium salamandrivorans]